MKEINNVLLFFMFFMGFMVTKKFIVYGSEFAAGFFGKGLKMGGGCGNRERRKYKYEMMCERRGQR